MHDIAGKRRENEVAEQRLANDGGDPCYLRVIREALCVEVTFEVK